MNYGKRRFCGPMRGPRPKKVRGKDKDNVGNGGPAEGQSTDGTSRATLNPGMSSIQGWRKKKKD